MANSSTLDPDQVMDRMAKGREATIAAGIVRPLIETQVEKIIQSTCREYSAGTVTHDQLLGAIAEITALKGLLYELERIHKQGVSARSMTHASS